MKTDCRILLPLLILALTAVPASMALANTAANTAIVNKATLTYNGTQTASSSVTVTVNLVPATPNISITSGTAAYTAANTPAITGSIVITSTSNGPASYTVTPSVTASTNTTLPTVSGVSTVSIGASVTTGVSTTTAIRVPAGGASGNGATVNGIAVNDTIVFFSGRTSARTVTGTTDNGDGTFSLTLDTPIVPADVPAAGVQVGERMTVNLSALPGTVVAQGTNITTTVQAVVSTTGASNATITTAPANSWTTPNPNVSFQKYSRNVTTASGSGTVTSFNINSVTSNFYTTGVTGKTGDTLEYVIVAKNDGAIDLATCAINDVLPTAYVSSPLGAYGGKEVSYIDTNNITSQITAAGVGTNLASYVAPNLVVNVGVGATPTAGTGAGSIPAAKSVTIAYQVTIK